MSRIISVVVVDDSAFMRKSLAMMLESDPQIKVVASACNGREGIEKIREYRPDLATMDIEMPIMDGLTALSIIMKEMPLPVLMVSSLTNEGAKATLDALNLGAVDFIPKELSYVSLNIVKIKEELVAKVKQIALSRSLQFRLQRIRNGQVGDSASPAVARPARPANPFPSTPSREYAAVMLGISTGGPFALMRTIPRLPADLPAGVAVVQHMPPHFTKSLAERLDSVSEVTVAEAATGDVLRPGMVLIAPGGEHLTFTAKGRDLVARVSSEPADTLYRPCVDVMISSAVAAARFPLLGVIMTGMGKDGLVGLKQIKKAGGYVIAQDEDSCVVYGMPKAAVDEGVADVVVGLDEIGNTIAQVLSRKKPK
jgi:two-component system chemotaxis response regulator CheB